MVSLIAMVVDEGGDCGSQDVLTAPPPPPCSLSLSLCGLEGSGVAEREGEGGRGNAGGLRHLCASFDQKL